MAGLQAAYMQGLISYPRTESRNIGRASAAQVIRIGEACRLHGLDMAELLGGPGILSDADGPETQTGHEALHPVCDLNPESLARFERILRAPIPFGDRSAASEDEVMEIMAALVARRAFEAARPVEMEPGDWRPDNGAPAAPEEARLLADLDWSRESLPALPWSRDLMTGVREWPLRAIAIDVMMSEGVGRPSTWAMHADMTEVAGEIDPGDIITAPRPSPKGRSVLKRIPRGLWNPATCRMIEAALRNAGNLVPEPAGAGMDDRIRGRVMAWLGKVPEEIRAALLEALAASGGGAPRDPAAAAAPAMPGVEDAAGPVIAGTGIPGASLPSPSPFVT